MLVLLTRGGEGEAGVGGMLWAWSEREKNNGGREEERITMEVRQ